jgi:hypothetical protein
MATVRLTKELQDDIRAKVHAGFRSREQSNHQRFAQMIDREQLKRDTRDVMLLQYGMSEEMYDAIPSGWLAERKSLYYGKLNDYNVHHVIGDVECTPPMRVHYAMNSEGYGSRTLNMSDPRFEKYVEVVRQHDTALKALNDEKQQVLGALTALFNKCTTLKQALELFPHLDKLVPEWAMDRHREKAEKRQKVELTAEGVNLDALSATLVRQRLHESMA